MQTRIRTVKPEFFTHADLHDLERTANAPVRLAFMGLWIVSDREGRFRWDPRELKLHCLPYDEVDFASVLDHLRAAGFIVRYEVNGKLYGWIPTWNRHQKPNHRERQSEFPAPPGVIDVMAAPAHVENELPFPPTKNQQVDAWTNSPGGTGTGTGTGTGGGTRDASSVTETAVPIRTVQKPTPQTPTIHYVDDSPPPGLTEVEYARRLLEDLGMPQKGNIIVVAEAIKAFSKSRSLPLPAAFEQLRARAFDARDRGDPVNYFWFQDARYLQPKPKSKTEVATDEFLSRFEREREILQRINAASA
jgi:hypothetical protein